MGWKNHVREYFWGDIANPLLECLSSSLPLKNSYRYYECANGLSVRILKHSKFQGRVEFFFVWSTFWVARTPLNRPSGVDRQCSMFLTSPEMCQQEKKLTSFWNDFFCNYFLKNRLEFLRQNKKNVGWLEFLRQKFFILFFPLRDQYRLTTCGNTSRMGNARLFLTSQENCHISLQ